MKWWHRICAWFLARRARREHSALAKFVRQSAFEIHSRQQDINAFEERLAFHRSKFALPAPKLIASDNVVSIESARQDIPGADEPPQDQQIHQA